MANRTVQQRSRIHTLPETKIIALENHWLEDDFFLGRTYFQGPCQFQGVHVERYDIFDLGIDDHTSNM